jgi:hypothetical protein
MEDELPFLNYANASTPSDSCRVHDWIALGLFALIAFFIILLLFHATIESYFAPLEGPVQ